MRAEWQDEDCRHWVRGLSGRGRKVPGDPAGAAPPMPRVPFGSAGSSEVVGTHLLPGPQTGWAKWRILPSRPPSDWHLLRRGSPAAGTAPPKLEESRGTTQGNPVHNTHTDPTLKPAAPSAAWSAHQTQPGDCQGLVSEPVPREQALLTTGLRGRGLGPLAPFPRVTADLAESAGRVLRKQHCAWDLVRPLTWPPAVSPEDPPLCHFGSFTVPGTHTPLADK